MSFNPTNISKADATAYSSSDDDENENDDYMNPSVDPRDDDFLDYNPRKRRRTGRDAKESAALGIFGSDSEDDGPGRRWKSKKDLRHKNMTFVSAGQQNMNEEMMDDDSESEPNARPGLGAKVTEPQEEENNYEDDEDEDEDEDADESMTGVGLGFRPSAQGLGWTPPARPHETPTKSTGIKSRYDGINPLGKGFVPSSANDPVLKPSLRDESPSAPQTPKPSVFGAGGGGKAKSFAARMMAKMGYVEGQGLGAQGQGRNVIIEATLRPQGVGLGAVKEKSVQERKEEKRQARMRGEEVTDSDEERKKAKRERKKKGLDSGTGSGASTPKRPKTRYLTAGDIQKAAPGLHIPDAFAPILDMTGRDQKLLTSSSGLLTPTAGTELVEQTEARKLARRAQSDLTAFVEEWKSLGERKAWLDMETRQREQELDELETEFSVLTVFSSVLDEVSQAARDQQWDPVISGLRRAQSTSPAHSEELAAIAVAAIHPFLRDAVQGWQPLDDPKLGNFASDLSAIQELLGLKNKGTNGRAVTKWEDIEMDGTHRYHQKSTTVYESMIYKLLFPKLVTIISQTWDVYDPAPLLAVFDKWEPLFPAFVRSQLLEQVVRRLDDAIGNWRPKKKQHNLPHLWLFPWLQHLPAHHLEPKGTGLVADVRRKFRQLIDVWEFEKGVIPGLKQWKDVFRPSRSQDQWKPLVMHHILPSMARYLRTNFRVNPSDQEPYLEMLSGVLKWTDIISTSMVAEVIIAEVFPMWHEVLYQWLTSSEANYEEIGAWFQWWEEQVFPAEISSLESIAAEFRKGNAMIEKALDLGDDVQKLPRPDGLPAHQPKSRPCKPKAEETVPVQPPPQPLEKPEPTFRDEVEDWCQENDLQFIPVRKANEAGKHYFRITARMDGKGGVLAYFKAGDILAIESRKTNMELRRDIKDDWGLLFEPLYAEVEQAARR
ncbi:GC-rich sequence DNA-binding factor-like protein-domain-containing protein [Biscogniauxia mediterranea]|nr:GC-rich sequence DNA-binding factor-like protein-domain-containing protein [Biscogniauxia mediterranea]